MASPCVVVASGGMPVTESPNGTPFTPAPNGFPVTIVANGGIPVVFISVSGALLPGGGTGPSAGPNAVLKSNQFTDGAWQNLGVTFDPGSYPGKTTPPTGYNATRVTSGAYSGFQQITSDTAGSRASIYMRSLTGVNQNVALYTSNSSNSVQVVTPAWQRFDVQLAAGYASHHVEASQAIDIEISSAQINPGTTVTPYLDNA